MTDDTRWLDDDEQRTWRAFLTAQRLLGDRLERQLPAGESWSGFDRALSGSAGPAGAPTSDEPACATDGDDTCTNRPTPARRAASRRARVPSTFVRA